MKMFRRGRVRGAVALLAALGLMAGCGSSPTDSGGDASTGTGGGATGAAKSDSGTNATGIAAVYAELQGLTGDARYQRLLSLAKDEGGTVSFYHSGDMTTENAAFTKKTGIKVVDFQATAERVAERVVQEKKAGRVGSDVVLGDGGQFAATGGIAQLSGPAVDEAKYKMDSLVSPIGIMMVPTFNTNLVEPSELPKSWEDYFTNFDEPKAIELTDWPWFYAVVHYLMDSKGMSQQAAVEMFTKGIKGAFTVDGHTLLAQLLASGQYAYVPNLYGQYFPRLKSKGAPLSEDGVTKDLPPTLTALYIGLTEGAKHPAAGLLYLEWMMSADGQKAIADAGYVPTSNAYDGPESLLQKYPYALFDKTPQLSASERETWQKLFDTVLRKAGTKKVGKS